jgi:hypothetical protein
VNLLNQKSVQREERVHNNERAFTAQGVGMFISLTREMLQQRRAHE